MSIGATIGCLCLVFSAGRRLRSAPLTALEYAITSVSLGLALASVLATALALFGRFDGIAFGASSVALTGLAFAWPAAPPKTTAPPSPAPTVGTWLLGALFIVGLGLRALPMDNPLGGRDPGSYTLRAQQTLTSGALDHHDPVLAEATRVYRQAPRAGLEDLLGSYPVVDEGVRVDRYEAPYRPGFYLADRDSGRVEPQFFHLYPSTLTVSGLLFGAERLHFICVLIATLALGLWACLVMRLFEIWTARLVCFGLLALNPLAIWTARQTLSEGVYGLWLGLALLLCLAWHRAQKTRRLPLPAAAGFLLGCATLVRGDAWVWAPWLALTLWGRERRSRDGAAIFVLIFALGVALHAHTSFAYLHDELLRRWPGTQPPSPSLISIAAGLGAVLWVSVDRLLASRPLDPAPNSVVWTRALLSSTLILLAIYLYGRLDAGAAAPYSRLDPLLPAAGPLWLLAAAAGLLWVGRREPALALRPYLPFALIGVTSVALFVPRQLPNAGLYYYGRYLTPVLLPVLALSAGLAIEALAQRAVRIGIVAAISLLSFTAWPLMSSAQTLMDERRGAAEAVERIAAFIDDDAVLIAGGDGWHRGFTFNQVAGALAMREGIDVMPYRDRQRTHAVALDILRHGVGERRPSVFLLINEASHHYTRPDDDRIVAGADDLLSAPLRARSVRHFEFWLDYLTPDRNTVPRRITRDGMRMSLIELELDPTQVAPSTEFRDGKAHGGTLRFARKPSAKQWREGRLCLHPRKAITLEFDSPDPRGGELIIEMHPGTPAQNVAAALRLDDETLSVHAPGLGSAPRGSLGPFAFAGGEHRLELLGGGLEGDGPCPLGAVASVSLVRPPQRAGASLKVSAAQALSLHRGPERGHPVKHSDWTSAQALTRFRTGLDPERLVRGLSLRVDADRPLEFPSSWLPGADLAPQTTTYDVVVTLTASRLSPGAQLQLVLDDEAVQSSELPREQRGNWQTPKLRWSTKAARVQARLELVDARPDDFVDVRDVSFFLREQLVTSVRNPP